MIKSNFPTTMCVSRVTLAAGSTSTLSSTGTILYCIDGKAYDKAALSNTATPTTDVVTGSAFEGVLRNKGSIFIVGTNAAEDLKVAQGSIVDLNTSGAFIQAPQLPPMPNDFCPIGYLVIKAGASANNTTGWVFGTNDMASVTGITYGFGDLMAYPSRPIIA